MRNGGRVLLAVRNLNVRVLSDRSFNYGIFKCYSSKILFSKHSVYSFDFLKFNNDLY